MFDSGENEVVDGDEDDDEEEDDDDEEEDVDEPPIELDGEFVATDATW